MAQSSSHWLTFEPDGASLSGAAVRDRAPALSSSGALARFEFESGKGNEGTKILMVEWSEDEDSLKTSGKWEVSWEGRSTIVAERDGAEGKTHRLYFLLGPSVQIPRIVKVSQAGGETMQTNPLPAIFSPELGASARAAGKKGVLHTIWGKKRLSVLQREIDEELRINGEGIGLEMALKEKVWIEENFGIGTRAVQDMQDLMTPSSPKVAGGGRLAEKLKGLKLSTSASDSQTRPSGNLAASIPTVKPSLNPLSPDVGDVAVSSFALFHGGTPRTTPRAVTQNPPSHIVAQQADSCGSSRMSSLDTIAGGSVPRSENDTEDDLFAVGLAPRSPDMLRSPFSFAARDTVPWFRNDGK